MENTGEQNQTAVQPQEQPAPQKPAVEEAPFDLGPQIIVKLLDNILNSVKQLLSENSFGFISKWLALIGNHALILAAALGFLYGLVSAIKFESFTVFLMGLGWVIGAAILLYVAIKFANAGETLIKANPTRLSVPAFLDSFAVVNLVAGIVALLMGIVMAIKAKEINMLFSGLGAFIFCECLVWLSVNPKMININIDPETGAGEDAIGIISFFMKGALKFVKIAYGAGAIYGTVLFIIAFVKLFGADHMGEAVSRAQGSASMLFTAALLPLILYLSFLLYYLMIDLIQSVLSLPKRIDSISK